ncbi:MAG: transcriptional repressor [Candidatus Dojkabacteria bacterium]|nr:transcriptional repressor [Candidatus Dojkabacteria bacterium]MDQ7021080.1 transcriptional repressor [Candidatus Dojkabacteria bacterium]
MNKDKILKQFNNNHLLSLNNLIDILPEIEKSVIYRNLKRLERDNIIKEVFTNSKETFYELSSLDDHQHLICESCGHVETIQKKIKIKNFSEVTNLTGICSDCS